MNTLAQIVPQKWANHLLLLARYATPRKVFNLLRTLFAYATGGRRLTGLPPFLKVEASNQCRIHCRYCYAGKSGAMFPLDRFRELMAQFAPYAFEVSLHDIGEPLLHPDLLEFIACAHGHGIGTIMSSSLSVERPDAYWRALAVSGLDRLVVAIDGLTPRTYNAYRTDGDLTLVMRNLEAVLREKRAARSRLHVTWQMLDLPWNRDEQAEARRRALAMGCERFMLVSEEALPRRGYFAPGSRIVRTRSCLMAYLMFIVTARGTVRPCCNLYRGVSPGIRRENEVGDLATQPVVQVWNSAEMQQLRDRHRIAERDYCRHCQEM